MNNDEICKANSLFNEGLVDELYSFIKPLLEVNDPYALYFFSCFSLPEWNESDEAFDRRNLSLLVESAESNVAPALYRLSSSYFTGDGVDVDIQKGKDYLDRALGLGFGPAKLTVGINFYYGSNGYPKDEDKALKLVMDAEKDGVESATSVLGSIKSSKIPSSR